MSGDIKDLGVDDLKKARDRYTQKELLLRYARGRVAHFWMRQFVTVLGVGILWFADGPVFALPALALAVFGELVDCLYLKHLARGLTDPHSVKRAYILSTVTASVQALTISGCVALAWFAPISHSAPLFALSFLVGTAINAGLVLPYHRASAIARLLVYTLTLVFLLLAEVLHYGAVTQTFALNVGGTAMLIYMAVAYIRFVDDGFHKNKKRTLAMTERGGELSRLNAQLLDREHELSLLSLIARHANDSMIISQPDGSVSFVNDAFTRTTGYEAGEILGRKLRDVLLFDGTDQDTLRQIISHASRGDPYRGEIELQRKDGTPFWYEVNQVPVRNPNGEIQKIVSVNRDATLAKQQKAELIAARQASERSARAKADFLATMSHEIRTPMNGILGMAELLVGTDLDQDQKLFAETIQGSAQGLLLIINDILDLSKLDAGKMALTPVDFNLIRCLEDSIRLLRPQAENKGIDLRLELSKVLPTDVVGDDLRLRQILLNLVGNAIKFTDHGHVLVRVHHQTDGAGIVLFITVEDTGIGIAQDNLPHIFERFSQAEGSTTRRFGGTGLGLTISKHLAQAMEGDITVSSTEGQGTSFTLTARLRPASRPKAPQDPAYDTDQGAQMSGLRVLVAEDNKVNRMLIQKYVADLDIDLQFALNGAEAVDLSAQHRFDVIFMDMSMPVMDGLEATRQIRQSGNSYSTIIAITANAFATDRDACLAAGMDGFLSKPVRRNDILTQLAQLAQTTAPVPSD